MDTKSITGPCLMIDREKCLDNIDRMVQKAKANDIIFRPHFKTHQSIAVGRWFREYGIDKITVSSLKMAYYFARNGWRDILVGIAYNPREYELYEKISAKCRTLITISCPDSARILAAQCHFPLDVMIKIDTGYNRTGIKWDDPAELYRTMEYLNHNGRIKIRGLMTHDGSTYGLNSRNKIMEHYAVSVDRIIKCRDKTGIRDLLISIGDTPSASLADNFSGIDEIRPGNFVFYDLMQYINGSCSFNDIAMALICPVIDIRPSSGTVVVHGGAVHFSKDSIVINKKQVYGMVARMDNSGWHKPTDEIYISSLSQEHGIIKYTASRIVKNIHPGDLIAVIPVHSCLTADCMGSYFLKGGESLDHMRQLPQDSEYSL